MKKIFRLFAVIVLVLWGLFDIRPTASAQPPVGAGSAWFCSQDVIVACFQPKSVSLLMPETRYLTLPSADWVQLSTGDWARFVAQFAELLPPEVHTGGTAPTAQSRTSVQQ